MAETAAELHEPLLRQPALVCRLRKRTTERATHLPTAGEVELENTSPGVVEIEVHTSPWQYLDLDVMDVQGRRVSESFYGDLFSPLERPYTLRLQPGEKYVGPVSLLGNVPEATRVPGTYTIRAVYQYKGLRAVSNPFSLELGCRQDQNGAAGSRQPQVLTDAAEGE